MFQNGLWDRGSLVRVSFVLPTAFSRLRYKTTQMCNVEKLPREGRGHLVLANM